MKRPLLAAIAGCAVLIAGAAGACRKPSSVAGPAERGAAPVSPWARKTLARLTLEEKAAQMIGVRAFGTYRHPRNKDARQLRDYVSRLKVGCVVVFESEVDALPRILNELQAIADVPLLVAADMERGISFRIRRGVRAPAVRDGDRRHAVRGGGALRGRGDGARGARSGHPLGASRRWPTSTTTPTTPSSTSARSAKTRSSWRAWWRRSCTARARAGC